MNAAEAAHWFMLHHRVEAAHKLANGDRDGAISSLDKAEFYSKFIYRRNYNAKSIT